MPSENLAARLDAAISFRRELLDPPHTGAFRLFNGFTEGAPNLGIDLFAGTAVCLDYSGPEDEPFEPEAVAALLRERLPWLTAILWKKRDAADRAERNGVLLHGAQPDEKIVEHGITYAIDLRLNRDQSFYADTRNLRQWLAESMRGKRLLNTFAYTGSLGVAAAAGGAARVVQTDLSKRFLALAERSYRLNDLKFDRKDFLIGDFFPVVARLKREGQLFDCVILDPPFFSRTAKGRVDCAAEPAALVNKVRPLVADGGKLVVVNNSLFLSGGDFLAALDALCDGTYLKRELLLPVPADFTGCDPEYRRSYRADPAPFNHPTKIAVLAVARKDGAA